ncbi:TolC family outer membrane protein [Rugamonas apoptosis]|uniref:TolC family outer membrane protein n=1 Tax=Rugamonas apoptosis TaxID=2758570 RepID=A0A7W2FDX5_9BURK|nr:TolC family outer membrane protein [Rugamonas apoptosis]MBA5689901.1 TolC family outer membrane protein [Rugamonas apoptosis]
MMKLHTKPAVLGLLLALYGGLAGAMDVADAYRQSLANDPASLAADQALLAGREQALQGDALLRPRVSLQAGVSRIHDHQTGELAPPVSSLLSTDSTGTARQATLQLVQPLYDRGALASRRQLHQQTELAQTSFAAARQEQALRVAQAYFGVLLAEETLRVVGNELAAVRQQRDRAQARFDVGQDRITDLREAQARLDAVTTREVAARSMLELRQAQFRETTGLAPDGLAPLAQSFVPRAPEPAALAAWQATGEGRSTAVLARQSALEIAQAELSKKGLAARPTVDLVASYGARNQSGNLSPLVAPSGDRNAAIGLVLNVPLYAGGGLDSRQREAAARVGQAEQELAAARRDVRLAVQEGYLAVTTGVSRVAAQEQALVSARSALDATSQGRDVGTRTALDVLDAQQRLYAAQLELMQGRVDYLLGRLRLAAAAGELNEDSLRTLDLWLEGGHG